MYSDIFKIMQIHSFHVTYVLTLGCIIEYLGVSHWILVDGFALGDCSYCGMAEFFPVI